MKSKINKPPKFNPDKGDVNQMEETYQHFMQIALRNGITEKTVSDIIVGLVRRLFQERHAKNWYKDELKNALLSRKENKNDENERQ